MFRLFGSEKKAEQKKEMMDAIMEKDFAKVQQLLKAGFDPNTFIEMKDISPNSPLAFAILLGRKEIALLLISAGANMHQKYKPKADSNELDLLETSISVPHKEVIEKLLAAGLDPNKPIEKDPNNNTNSPVTVGPKYVWQMFAAMGHQDIVELLINKHFDLKLDVDSGYSILDVLQPSQPEILAMYKAALEVPVTEGETFMRMIERYAAAIKKEREGEEGTKAKEFRKMRSDIIETGTKIENGLLIYISLMNEHNLLMTAEFLEILTNFIDRTRELYSGGSTAHKAIAALIEEKLVLHQAPRPR
jgi:hypothetical protein